MPKQIPRRLKVRKQVYQLYHNKNFMIFRGCGKNFHVIIACGKVIIVYGFRRAT